ncbi:MAG: hypothetical protein QF719_10770 [Chloroflexota bacterium]|jgi:hypothetical protein|nr:hypothetical protein [Chloroflexota bacterium]MDP6508734.1 hypothetical protein [Chloroflexota bacterium]MDP6758662.1 hypothetical protein [Chloroflexota bacterium]
MQVRRVTIAGYEPGSVLAKDLTSDRGDLLLAKGSALSARRLESLLEKG